MVLGHSKLISRALLVAVFLLGITTSISSSLISDGIFDSPISSSTSRSLLQMTTPCKVNFEFMNYTIIISRCKGPYYPSKPCCDAFLQFACPYADEINDLTTDCATTMFSYINLYGKYPPGLFANQCQGDKEGLLCPANYTRRPNEAQSSGVDPSSPALPASVAAAAASLLGFLSFLALF